MISIKGYPLMQRKNISRIIATTITLISSFAAYSTPSYIAEALPLPGTNSLAHSVGNDGTVVGFYRETQYRGFATQNSTTTTYPTLGFGGTYNKFIEVNNTSVATGRALTTDFTFHAFTYDITSGGGLQDIGTLGGSNSYGEDINDAGQVVGFSDTASGQSHAFSYSGGSMTDLGTLGGNDSNAYGVNNHGVIVGDAQLSDTSKHAFSYQNGVMTDLGSLGGTSAAIAINDNGLIAGNAQVNGQNHAALFTGTGIIDLGTLGGLSAEVFDINNLGWVVGTSLTTSGESHAFLYGNTFGMLDLNDLLINSGADFQTLTQAWSVNDYGQIVGTGVSISGVSTAFSLTLTQVPVPAALWLFLTSLIGLVWAKKTKAE
jgi:probable HAF family extracellular repeat protein